IDFPQPLPVLSLVRNYSVMADRDQIFRAIESGDFDPRSRVILESEPRCLPSKGNSIGETRIVSSSTDSLEIQVDIETPAILLITNNFAHGWRAHSLQAGSQPEYILQTANWSHQAIALTAGKHHILLEYS